MSEQTVVSRRLVEYGRKHKEAPQYLHLEDVEDVELTLLGIEKFKGDFGEYVLLHAKKGEDTVTIRTGAELVVDALMDVDAQGLWPVQAVFYRTGRVWRFS